LIIKTDDKSGQDLSLNEYKDHVYVFLCMVLLAVRMVADVTETRDVIPNLGFKTCMTIKGVLNPNFRTFSFERILILGFRVL